MGHLLHGTSLALASQVERYGLRTMRGNTGGVNVEAPTSDNNNDDATIAARDPESFIFRAWSVLIPELYLMEEDTIPPA